MSVFQWILLCIGAGCVVTVTLLAGGLLFWNWLWPFPQEPEWMTVARMFCGLLGLLIALLTGLRVYLAIVK